MKLIKKIKNRWLLRKWKKTLKTQPGWGGWYEIVQHMLKQGGQIEFENGEFAVSVGKREIVGTTTYYRSAYSRMATKEPNEEIMDLALFFSKGDKARHKELMLYAARHGFKDVLAKYYEECDNQIEIMVALLGGQNEQEGADL